MNFTKDFEEILVDFFKKYDEKNLKLVPDIMRRFRQDKRDVIMHLCSRYNVDINSIEGVEADMTTGPADRPKPKPVAETTEDGTGDDQLAEENDSDEAPVEKKSKKKLFMIIGIVVLLAGAAGGYFMFMGDDKKPATAEETVAPEEPVNEEPESDPEPEPDPEPLLDSAVTDSVQTDSAAVDTTGEAIDTTVQEATE